LNRMVPRLLRATEVAAVLGLGRSKVYDMMKRGQLPVVRIGKAIRVPADALERWIKNHTSAAA
jgi:excisionase family DNA binding protein